MCHVSCRVGDMELQYDVIFLLPLHLQIIMSVTAIMVVSVCIYVNKREGFIIRFVNALQGLVMAVLCVH